ncbi:MULTISPECIES: DUF3247 family protein [unclassified Lysobacter]|uniref:DUF3247 family protein n=1 Tax=unclassified Lysobacter TaxID=2635362 RepID=UPI001BE9AE24|nr:MULTISPECIES: DUF3247 family protein [unclassified Lysobacter]MBT2748747.1 DUF3247 family protein [Lysobacter sp. ISL-42]MBT2751682.1 DUF3247 family protein [Lysobacter sp. ISL-50]MBT2775876.1 DUF3247 family protein [Lysobacter sp. ISL-54]MBT2782160.1 DUF3247 family protein [Lysobacter sp. ISL-52]
MTKLANRVYTDPSHVRRLSLLIEQLPDEGQVDLTLIDGSRQIGVVTARPSLQTFLDPAGNEGVNAVLRLDDLNIESKTSYLWVDEILEVRPIHSADRRFAR